MLIEISKEDYDDFISDFNKIMELEYYSSIKTAKMLFDLQKGDGKLIAEIMEHLKKNNPSNSDTIDELKSNLMKSQKLLFEIKKIK